MSRPPRSTWPLLEILKETADFFAKRGLDNARLQAELLLAAVLGLQRLDLYLQFDKILTPAEVDAYRDHVRRRLQGEPVQHITGTAGFRRLDLQVNSAVLIPRPETELVVEAALACLQDAAEPRVLDLGCGSGAIALAIAQECAAARVWAVDISAEALELAQANAARHDLQERVEWGQGDLFEAVEGQHFQLIVSNPPYIPTADIAVLEPEVREYEPHLALDGGGDGLDYYRRIAAEARDRLTPDGALVLEIGVGQAEEVSALFADGWQGLQVQPDLAGIPRVVSVRRAD